jgi:hypothetical protein
MRTVVALVLKTSTEPFGSMDLADRHIPTGPEVSIGVIGRVLLSAQVSSRDDS